MSYFRLRPAIAFARTSLAVLSFLLPFCSFTFFTVTEATAQVSPSQNRVTGRVTDDNGNPVSGVTVTVKGSQVSTQTDAAGTYTINAPANAALVFTSVGFTAAEVDLRGKRSLNVTLTTQTSSLGEVVVVGYGTQRKVDLTGAVASVTRKDFANRPFTSPDQILGGRVPGVNIANRSGDPGAPIDVRIRGVGTTGNNQPLWVIDGVPIVQTSNITVNTGSSTESNPLSGINTNDIESIDVLKDASAAAIYGARAANGVIIVTTRRGKEGKTSVTYDGSYGVQYVPKGRHLDVLNVEQYIALQSELGRDLSAFKGRPFVDWQDAIFKRGAVQNHNLTVSGGSQKANFNVSGGYLDNAGVELGQGFKRASLKVNSDINVGKYLRFGESVLISSVNRLTQSESGLYAAYSSALNAPYYNIYGDGFRGYNLENDQTHGPGATGANYVWRSDQDVNRTTIQHKKFLGSVYGELEPFKGLKYKMTAGIDYNVGDGYFFQEAMDFGTEQRRSLLVQERPLEQTTTLAHTLTYNHLFGNHNLTALVGYEETSFKFNKMRIQGSGLFNSNVQLPAVATTVASANEADQWALRGLLGRLFYSYNDRYLFTFNLRRDATSRFSPDHRSGIFPSFSAGWRVSEEAFMRNQKLFNNLKLRASWGQSGNQFTGQNFAYLPSLATTIFYVIGAGQSVVRGPAPIVFANKDLKWERSTQTDVGLDASLLGNKVEVTFDYYHKITNDVLLSLPIPYTSGYFLPADANLGRIRNTGMELSAYYRNRLGPDFRYSIGGNITTVNNKVLTLGSVSEIISGYSGAQTHRTSTGQPLGYFYGFKTDGIYQNAGEVAKALPDAYSAGPQPGDIRFVDVNGDGRVDAGDRTYLGKSIPDYFYGINLSVNYKQFDVTLFLQGVGGLQIYNGARVALESMTSGNNQLTSVLNRWKGEGSSNTIPRASLEDPNGNNRYSDRWIEDGDYMRIKNLQIGYTFKGASLSRMTRDVISNSRIYIGFNNLATFTKYKGYDPEVTRGFSFQKGEFPLANGQDPGGSPQPTLMQIGWSITF